MARSRRGAPGIYPRSHAEEDILTDVVRDVVVYNWFTRGWKYKIYLDKLTRQVNFTDGAETCSGWHGWWDYQWSKETEGIWTIVFHRKGFENMAIKHVLHQDSNLGEVYHTWWGEAKKGGGGWFLEKHNQKLILRAVISSFVVRCVPLRRPWPSTTCRTLRSSLCFV